MPLQTHLVNVAFGLALIGLVAVVLTVFNWLGLSWTALACAIAVVVAYGIGTKIK